MEAKDEEAMKIASIFTSLALAVIASIPQPANAEAAISAEKLEVIEQVEALEAQISDISRELWNYSEIALRETQSAEFLASILEGAGFSVDRGVADMPTAFVAEWGRGEPIIGILAEYDALPNIGNAPVPLRLQRDDGHPHGHGCGHFDDPIHWRSRS